MSLNQQETFNELLAENRSLKEQLAALRQELEGLAAFWKAEGKRCYDIAHERPVKVDESVMAQSVRFWHCADELQAILGKHGAAR